MLINGLSFLAIVPVVSFSTGAGKLCVISTYRELIKENVIVVNEEPRAKFRNGMLSEDWIDIPYFLTEAAFNTVKLVAIVFAIVHFACFCCAMGAYFQFRSSLKSKWGGNTGQVEY
jgi:hypothetical protein